MEKKGEEVRGVHGLGVFKEEGRHSWGTGQHNAMHVFLSVCTKGPRTVQMHAWEPCPTPKLNFHFCPERNVVHVQMEE